MTHFNRFSRAVAQIFAFIEDLAIELIVLRELLMKEHGYEYKHLANLQAKAKREPAMRIQVRRGLSSWRDYSTQRLVDSILDDLRDNK